MKIFLSKHFLREAGDTLRLTYGTAPACKIGTECFVPLPRNIDEALTAGYVQVDMPDKDLQNTECYVNPEEPKIGLICDVDTRGVVGLNVAIDIENDVKNPPFDFLKLGWILYTLFGRECYAIQILYVSPESLERSAQERIASYNPDDVYQETHVYLPGRNGDWMAVPRDENKVAEETVFTIQGYLPQMGRHYFEKVTKTMQCTEEEMPSWFLLFEKYSMVGIGCIMPMDHPAEVEGKTSRFESPAEAAIKLLVPNGPACLPKMTITTLHVYTAAKPWNIGIPLRSHE
ncbi:uncharacterized protein LOC112057143 isoform X2 [Bicyclus anynana]|uniref:Uncharacterized protein LOC112057143 isoform X2 n=1 Tax=Bicyclus anynana TaxID=110368 RepID=A0A6J1P6F9_BICAN|nr:uncharacterized protein LOC112057143 isoform X2 [Bicyclus anynana]